MMEPIADYPSSFHQRVLAREAPGGPPAALNVVVPSVTRPGEAFDVRIAVLDEQGHPSLQCDGRLELDIPEQAPAVLTFRRGVPAAGRLTGVRLLGEGLFRLRAGLGPLGEHSNPTLCTSDDVPGIYWGDPHVHTILSNCHVDTCRSLNFCFTAARHLTGLDWVAAADHVSNGRCDESKWKEQRSVADHHCDPPRFATIPAYEASHRGGAGGDNTVYMARFFDEFVDEYDDGSVKTLCEKLAGLLPADEFFVAPHHTTRAGKHGEISDDIYPGPAAMPVIEIYSKWGTSEYRGNPNPLQKIHPGPSYTQDMLARGLRLGFIAGTDTHATMPGGFGGEPGHIDNPPGLTAVRCRDVSRRAIFDAIRCRRCYAARGERVVVHGSIGGCQFGEARSIKEMSAPPKVDVLIAAKSDIERVDLVRNGEPIHSSAPDSWRTRFLYEDRDDLGTSMLPSVHLGRFAYYYVRVTCRSGAQAWSSPVWIVE